jgi:GT2 family glycosyltransferase
MSKVCIVVLNWNGWRDTIECLESIFQSDYANFQIVVCDNNSSDQSMEHLRNWAEGKLDSPSPDENFLRSSSSPIPKPLNFLIYTRDEAEAGGDSRADNAQLVIIQTGDNLGYAGGNNVGLRYVLARPEFEYVWILNNDLVVAMDALSEMLKVSADDSYERPIGSYHYNYFSPDTLEMVGGLYVTKFLAIRPDFEKDINKVDYLSGASLLLTRKRLESLGLILEEYFLNAEDLEYTYFYKVEFQKQNPDVSPFLVAGSIWHKVSATQGKSSFLHSYYYTRNILYSSCKIGNLQFSFTFLNAVLRLIYALLLGKISLARGIAVGTLAFFKRDYGIYR